MRYTGIYRYRSHIKLFRNNIPSPPPAPISTLCNVIRRRVASASKCIVISKAIMDIPYTCRRNPMKMSSKMTIIHLKYIEKNVVDDEESGIEVSAVKQTAGSINESEKELMVNIDCPIGIILDYIRKIVSLEGEEIDLCDETNNQLKNLTSFPGCTIGTEILASNSTYFIIKIERDPESGRISRILPMVSGSKSVKIANDIMSRIRAPRSSTASRNRSASLTGKINADKIIGGKNNHQEKRNKLGKPASRAKEGQGR